MRKNDGLDLETICRLSSRLPAFPQGAGSDWRDDKIPLRLTARERKLIAEHSLSSPELTDRLRDPFSAKSQLVYSPLEELDEPMGHVASEATHVGKKTQQMARSI